MNNKQLMEKAVLAVLGVAVLYALAVVLWFVHFDVTQKTGAWRKAINSYEKARKTYQAEKRLIGEKAQWADAYETEKSAMPTFEQGKATDTTLLQKMDELAAKHYVQISNRQGKEEVVAGEVLELPIEVKNWESSLEGLVRFLHELENTSEGMFDVRAINFKPSNKRGYLKGSFTLTCAYMRE